MTELWSLLLRAFSALLFSLTHVCGGSVGTAIIVLSFSFRLALLPMTLRIARRSMHMQQALKTLQPELKRIQERHAKDPARMQKELQAAYQRAGVRPIRDSGLVGTLLQLPFIGALYSAIREGAGAGGRFLWIGNLARPDALLALLVTLLSGVLALLAPNATANAGFKVFALLSMTVTFLIVSRLAAGVGLYWALSSLVGVLQALILRRAQLAR